MIARAKTKTTSAPTITMNDDRLDKNAAVVATLIRANPAKIQAKNKTDTWFIFSPLLLTITICKGRKIAWLYVQGTIKKDRSFRSFH